MPKIIPVQYLEDLRKKVTSINETNTEEQYPSAKAVYDAVSGVDNFYKDLDPVNKLNFSSPSLINVEYMKTVPGWGVQFGENQVSSSTNQWFSGDTGNIDYKEIEFVPTKPYVDLCFQTADTKHNNTCRIRNLFLSRVDGQPMTLGSTRTEPFSELVYQASDDFESGAFNDDWAVASKTRVTVDKSASCSGTYGVRLTGTGWGGMLGRPVKVTPNMAYRVSFKVKAISNGVNVSLYDGNSTSAPKMGFTNSKGEYASKYCKNTEWEEISVTVVPTGDYIYFNINGSGKSTKDEAYFDEWSVTHTTAGLVPWEHITLNTNSIKNKDTKTIYINGNSAGTWADYVTFPLSNLDTTKNYTIRFKADISAGGINLKGTDVEYLYKYYIGANGEHFATFKPLKSSCSIMLSGSGIAGTVDSIVVSDIHIYNSAEALGVLNESNARCIVKNFGSYDGDSVIITANNTSYATGLQIPNIEVVPGVKYKLTFTAIYIDTKTYDWKPYTTLTDEDKIALVTEDCETTERLNLGGPWTGKVTDDLHRLKINIRVPLSQATLCPRYIPKMLVFGYDATVTVKLKATITLKRYMSDAVETIEWSGQGSSWNESFSETSTAIIPIQPSFSGLIESIEIVFRPEVIGDASEDNPTRQYITKLALYGTREIFTEINNNVFKSTPNREAKFDKRLFAPEFIGNMDDGCVD